MKMDLVCKKFDEYYTPEYAILPIIKYIPLHTKGLNTSIYCPFDTEQSNYVKLLPKHGLTNIVNSTDFFNQDFKYADYIISNPPYSIKNEVLNHLFETKKPFAMLVGVVGLFESKKRFNLFKNNTFEVMYFDKRISYFTDYANPKPNINPPYLPVEEGAHMKRNWHLPLNTAVTVILLILVCILLYTSTVRQDAKSDTRYKDILNLIAQQQANLEIEQRIRGGLEREVYNLRLEIPTSTMGEVIIPQEAFE